MVWPGTDPVSGCVIRRRHQRALLSELLTCENNLLCLHMVYIIRLVYTTSSSTPILWLAATTSILSVDKPSCLTVRVLLVLVSDCFCQTQVRQNNYWDGNAVYHSMPINSKLWHKLNFQSLLPSLSRMILRDFMSLTREWFSWNQFKDSDKLTPLFCSIAMAECIEPGTWTFGRNYLSAEAKIYY